jgi:hypothetical protein
MKTIEVNVTCHKGRGRPKGSTKGSTLINVSLENLREFFTDKGRIRVSRKWLRESGYVVVGDLIK